MNASMDSQQDVVIIGGGVIGVCSAYYLAQKGIHQADLTGVDNGTRGTYYFDDFESHRQTYIGP